MSDLMPNREKLDRFYDEVYRYQRLYNEAIRTLFGHDPLHAEPEITYAKIELLDKAYSAGIRRWTKRCQGTDLERNHPIYWSNRKSDYVQPKCDSDALRILIDTLYDKANEDRFKSLIRKSLDFGGTLKSGKLQDIVSTLEDFSSLLSPVMRVPKRSKTRSDAEDKPSNEEEPANIQSFYSKYLWFHAGAFPVYDRDARSGLLSLSANLCIEGDLYWYRDYVNAFHKLLIKVYGDRGEYSPDEIKQLDGYLVQLGRGQI